MKNVKFLIATTIALLIIGYSVKLTIAYKNKAVYNDLRTRVTGTRLQDYQKSAYFGKWEQGDPIYLQNATRVTPQLVNGNTVTPAVLLLTKKLHTFSLSFIKDFWFYSSYFCIIAIIAMLCFKLYKSNKAHPLMIIVLALFALSTGWKIHCFTGQMYIYYTFLASLSLFLFTEKKYVAAAIFAGIVTLCRLPMALLFVPIFLYKKNNAFIVTYIITIAFCIICTQVFVQPNIWNEYFAAMQQYAFENANLMPEGNVEIFNFASQTEGVHNYFDNNTLNYYFNTLQSDIFSIQRLLFKLNMPSSARIMYVFFATFSISLFVLMQKLNANFWLQKKHFILFCIILTLCFDYFLPAKRFSYNFVQLMLLLSVVVYFKFKINNTAISLFALGVLLNVYKLHFIPDAYSLGEVCCIFAAVVVLTTNKIKEQNEVFELGWLGSNITTWLGLYPKVGLHN